MGPRRSLPAVLAVCLLGLAGGGCVQYFANLARSFNGVVSSPSADLSAMIHGMSTLCRRQADLAYLRSRIEDPADRAMVPWRQRLQSRYSGRAQSIDAGCAALDQQAARYLTIHGALLSYASSLRALADSENNDFRDSFQMMGSSLGQLAQQVQPDEPDWGLVMLGGAQAVNQLLALAVSARSEADIKRAVLAAAPSVDRLLKHLSRAVDTYDDLGERHVEALRSLVDEVEQTTRPPVPRASGRSLDLLSFYDLAQHLGEEADRVTQSARSYRAALGGIRGAHEAMVNAAKSRIPPRQAFQLVQRSLRGLMQELSRTYQGLDYLYLRGAPP